MGEEIRRKDQDLLQELNGYESDEEGEIEFEPGPEDILETGESSKGKEPEQSPKKYKEQPERIEKSEISKDDEKLLKDYRKELKDLGRSNDYDDFINSIYSGLFADEIVKLEKLRAEKNALGTDQIQKTYDLGRPDLAILWRKQLYFIIDFQYVNNYKMYV